MAHHIQPAPLPAEGDQRLNARELEVLQLLSDGCVTKEIPDKLGLSPHGVDKRMRRIYDKLQVQNVAAANRKGWI